jgi:hypothetical protein
MVFQLNGAAAMQTVFHYHALRPAATASPWPAHAASSGDRLASASRG